MGKPGVNLQDSFLNQVRKDGVPIKIVLLDGSQLDGVVRGFDNFTINVVNNGVYHLVYKHGIGQIISSRAPQHREEGHGEARHERDGDRRGGRPAPSKDGAAAEKKGDAFNAIDLSKVNLDS